MVKEDRERLAELVVRAQGGDRAARDRLMEDTAQRAARLIGAFTGYGEDQDDILQAVLTDVYLGLRKLRDPLAFRTWLARIVQRRTRDFLRRRYAEAELWSAEECARLADVPSRESTDSFLEPLYMEHVESVLREIRELPEKYQAILTRVLLEGNTIAEVATQMDLGENTVKTRYYRGVKRLKRRLESTA